MIDRKYNSDAIGQARQPSSDPYRRTQSARQPSSDPYRRTQSVRQPSSNPYQRTQSARQPSSNPYQRAQYARPSSADPYRHTQRARQLRRQRQRRRRIICGAALVLLVFIIILIITSAFGGKKTPDTSAPVMPASIAATQSVQASPTVEPTSSVQPTAEPTVEPTAEPVGDVADPVYAALRPQAKEGFLPVFRSIDTQDKVIAITVDDCFQASNLRAIIDLAISNNAKLTFFPIGEQALREPQQAALKYAWENGMELENHTLTHNGLYGCSDEELAQEIYLQNLALSKILGVQYQCHFLRPKGGDARNDQRIHAYISQLGYYGVAHWSRAEYKSIDNLKENLAPGQIYLFHTTNKDLEHLNFFIPYAVSQGYRLVTLNELFGYPANSYTPLEKPIDQYEVPALEPYERVAVRYAKGSYAYGVKLVQQRLVELHYLSDDPDGIFGKNTAKAVGLFQQASSLEVTGEADADTQTRLFAEDAAVNSGQPV